MKCTRQYTNHENSGNGETMQGRKTEFSGMLTFSETLSSESGESMAKQIKTT